MKSPITFSRQLLSVEVLQRMRPFVFLSPHYQRQGDVWPLTKRRLLMDSILNGFLVPPMYWHVLGPQDEYFLESQRYAVVDGRQRLEALFSFLDGDLRLDKSFSLFQDPSVDLAGRTLDQVREAVPWVYSAFMRTTLEVVVIDTRDLDLVEELFSRLNEGVPLNAAERRNRGKILPPLVSALVEGHRFFTTCLPFGNGRYRHYDLVAKFMQIEDRQTGQRIPDLRKGDLDRLFDRFRKREATADFPEAQSEAEELLLKVERRLDRLALRFVNSDLYLGSVGMVTLYYAVDKYLEGLDEPPLMRKEITHFESLRDSVKNAEEETLTPDQRLVIDFARYAQGPTSGRYLSARLDIMIRILRPGAWTTKG